MEERIIRLSEVDEFPVVPEGIYDAVITSIDPYIAASGREAAWWRFKILGEVEYAGQVVSANTILPVDGMPKSELRKCWKFKSFLRTLGISLQDRPLKDIINDVVGKRVKVEVLNDTFGGVERSYVNSILPTEEVEIKF